MQFRGYMDSQRSSCQNFQAIGPTFLHIDHSLHLDAGARRVSDSSNALYRVHQVEAIDLDVDHKSALGEAIG